MNFSFSVNQYDEDGDLYEKCIMIWINDQTLIKFKDYEEYEKAVTKLDRMRKEIEGTWKERNN